MLTSMHHVGVASKNLEKDQLFFEALGYSAKGGIHVDAKVGIRVLFMSGPGRPDMELVQNLESDGPISAHLQSKRRFYHVAYVTDDIETDAAKLVAEQSAIMLVPITTSDGPKIKAWCYLMFRNSSIIELVQEKV